MKSWYYQIKAKHDSDDEYFRWSWPPVFSGKVEADTKAKARELIDQEYGQKFPMRVLEKDLHSAKFLLNLREIEEGDTHTQSLFTVRDCVQCGDGFRVIDHYNDGIQRYVGRDFCSDDCKTDWAREHDTRLFNASMSSNYPPVIYKIENKNTGMAYIGQTTQPFTLRWWQHFFHGANTKFHQAIDNSHLTDWVFSIIEVIKDTDIPDGQRLSDFISGREQYWIDHFNTIAAGYNTATAKVTA